MVRKIFDFVPKLLNLKEFWQDLPVHPQALPIFGIRCLRRRQLAVDKRDL